MGWTFVHRSTRASIIAEVLSSSFHETVDHVIHGNVIYAIKRVQDRDDIPAERRGQQYIAVILISGRGDPGYQYGYKLLDETMGPCYYDCPLRFLDSVPCPDSTYAVEWRAAVRKHHAEGAARRRFLRALRVGDTVTLVDGCRPASLRITCAEPLKGQGPDGRTYSVPPRYVKVPPEALATAAPAFDERYCSGTFDGFAVGSDADPGL